MSTRLPLAEFLSAVSRTEVICVTSFRSAIDHDEQLRQQAALKGEMK